MPSEPPFFGVLSGKLFHSIRDDKPTSPFLVELIKRRGIRCITSDKVIERLTIPSQQLFGRT